jgi:hypothetical protein
MILIGFRLPCPTVCDRHANCMEADAWARRFGKTLEHPNRRAGKVERFSPPACSAPGCTRLVWGAGMGHEGHVDGWGPS